MGNFRTPLIASQREDGSTFYTFSSAMEDIGLNINERNNKVRLSNYVLLDIPEICFQDNAYYDSGYFNISKFFLDKYSGGKEDDYAAFKADLKNGSARDWFKMGLQNYMLNMETTLRNQGTYDHSTAASVTERCFWKFLRHSGAFKPDVVVDGKYFHEDWGDGDVSVNPENTVIKGFGTIETSSQSSNVYTINNETYVLVPSSYGQMKYLLQPVEDNNYMIGTEYEITSKDILLEGHTLQDASIDNEYLLPFTDSASDGYLYTIGGAGSTSTQAKEQMLQMVFDTTILKDELAPDLDSPTISYDELASNTEYILASQYKFNAVLIYYTIYDSVGNSIATNLFGILILNDVVKTTDNPGKDYNNLFKFDEIVKYKSNNGKVGSSHFFRLNIQTASIYDNTNTQIIDFSSGEAGVIQDFGDVVANLKTTVDILKGNAVVFNNLHEEVTQVKHDSAEAILKIDDMQKEIDDLTSGNVRTISADEVDANKIVTDSIEAKDESLRSDKKFYATDGTIQEIKSTDYGAVIDDTDTAADKTWSSNKISKDIKTHKHAATSITVEGIDENLQDKLNKCQVFSYGGGAIDRINVDVAFIDTGKDTTCIEFVVQSDTKTISQIVNSSSRTFNFMGGCGSVVPSDGAFIRIYNITSTSYIVALSSQVYDTAPKANSSNLLTSGSIFNAIGAKLNVAFHNINSSSHQQYNLDDLGNVGILYFANNMEYSLNPFDEDYIYTPIYYRVLDDSCSSLILDSGKAALFLAVRTTPETRLEECWYVTLLGVFEIP